MRQLHSDLRERLTETLTPVFGQIPSFISDSPAIVEWLKSIDCPAFEFREASNISSKYTKNVLVIAVNTSRIPPYKEWQTLFRNSRVLIIPLISFDPSMDAAVYTVELLARSTFEAAAIANERWLKLLMGCKQPLIFSGKGCDLVCEVEEDVYVMRPKTEAQLSPGEWDSIGSYFEVGMVPQPEDIRPAFIVNGILSVPGVAVAHHRQMRDDLLPLAMRAWELFQRLRDQNLFPLLVRIENSRVVHVFAGEKDIAGELEDLTNRKRESVLTEMAFSTNEGMIPENIDWTKNAQLNEGALGIHVGIGDGLTGAHIDLICPEVKLKNQ